MPTETRGQTVRRRGPSRRARGGGDEGSGGAEEDPAAGPSTNGGGHHHHHDAAAAASDVQAKEQARSKIVTRVTFAVLLLAVFFGIAWAGHLYIFLLVCGIQVMLFKELVAVRYKAA